MSEYITLYDAANEVESLIDQIDMETGEVSEQLNAALGKFEDKAQAVVAYILNQNATLDAIHEAMNKLEMKASIIKNRSDNLRAYLLQNMKRTGITSIQSKDGIFTAKLYVDRDEVVDIFDARQLPHEYMRVPKAPEPAPDKGKIKSAIKRGEEIPGVKLTKKDRIEIR